jgi:hypothetical protein
MPDTISRFEPTSEADCFAGCEAALEECEHSGRSSMSCDDSYNGCYRECERVAGRMGGSGEGI